MIFKSHELDEDDEIPAPFVFEKHKAEFLRKALEGKQKEIEPTLVIEDDEDIVEQELMDI